MAVDKVVDIMNGNRDAEEVNDTAPGTITPVQEHGEPTKKEYISKEHQEMLKKMIIETAPAMAVHSFVSNLVFTYPSYNMGPNDRINENTGEIIRGPLAGFLPQTVEQLGK